jgi:signal transduction histidine kinase
VKYLSLAKIDCKFDAPDVIPPHHLTAEVRRNLFLVVKEALHNVVKHSRASEVSIAVRVLDAAIKVLIKDNGNGFLADEDNQSGNGVVNMKRRMNDIGGVFRIESAPGCGTQVAIATKIMSL